MMESGLSAQRYLRVPARLQGWPIVSICLGLVAVLAAYYALRSFMLAITETNALPIGDVYVFYSNDFFAYLDGHYSLRLLFTAHNEHPILATRLILFVDSIWFEASGKFATVVSYFLVFLTSIMMACLTAAPNTFERAGLTLVFLGLGSSAIQLDNLSMPFQAPFFFVHAFALASLIALRRALEGRRWWYMVAFACDFAAVFSLSTGVLLGCSFIALAVWARRIDRWFAIFLGLHLLLILLFVWIVASPGGPAVYASMARRVAFFLAFLGNVVVLWPKWVLPAGAVIAVICVGLFSWLTWRALFRGAGYRDESVIAAFAAFAILEAMAASATRAHLGVDYALSLKYTTCTLLLLAALFAFAWRAVPRTLSRLGALLALGAVLVIANSREFENGWRTRNRAMDAIFADIRDGNIPASAPAYLGASRDNLVAVMARFRELHLGPFRHAN
jgi:hypothetical protein